MTTNNSVTTKPEVPTEDNLDALPSAAIAGVSAENTNEEPLGTMRDTKPTPTNNILWKATGRVCEGRGMAERVKMYEKKGGGWRVGKHVDETVYTTLSEFYKNEIKPRKEAKELMVKRRMGEAVGREAKEIAGLTGTRDSIVQKFIDDFNLNAKNLFKFIAKGKEKVRKDFATAMAGRAGNRYQGDFVGMFGEAKINEMTDEVGEADGMDHEVSMARASLINIGKACQDLMGKIGSQEKDLPGWIQDHITNSENYIMQASKGYYDQDEKLQGNKITGPNQLDQNGK
jgi:hypothetical protein